MEECGFKPQSSAFFFFFFGIWKRVWFFLKFIVIKGKEPAIKCPHERQKEEKVQDRKGHHYF